MNASRKRPTPLSIFLSFAPIWRKKSTSQTWEQEIGISEAHGFEGSMADEWSAFRNYPETGFAEIEVRTALRIARISSNGTSGPFRRTGSQEPSAPNR